MSRMWTSAEVAIVQKVYPMYGVDGCKPYLKRSSLAIKQLAYKMGINRNKATNSSVSHRSVFVISNDGRQAAKKGMPEDSCPYAEGSDIGKRCAWLAGYRDYVRFGE